MGSSIKDNYLSIIFGSASIDYSYRFSSISFKISVNTINEDFNMSNLIKF